MKVKSVKGFNKTAEPMWCVTDISVDKQNKQHQTQTWYSSESEAYQHEKEEK